MIETLRIVETLEELKGKGERAVLATVVRTSGSTYRKEGAKLLISEKGDTIGSISAGCLEGDVLEIVPEVLKSGEPRLLRYDNTAPEEIVWGLGLGCNGIVEVFVEPVEM
ncbi:XdhC family protein [bacterium]|nr:XdhC family protein [bacterium]